MSLEYEPSSKPLHVSARDLFLHRRSASEPRANNLNAVKGFRLKRGSSGLDYLIHAGFTRQRRSKVDFLGGVPREQKMLKGHLPRVIYHQVYYFTKRKTPIANLARKSGRKGPLLLDLLARKSYHYYSILSSLELSDTQVYEP